MPGCLPVPRAVSGRFPSLQFRQFRPAIREAPVLARNNDGDLLRRAGGWAIKRVRYPSQSGPVPRVAAANGRRAGGLLESLCSVRLGALCTTARACLGPDQDMLEFGWMLTSILAARVICISG